MKIQRRETEREGKRRGRGGEREKKEYSEGEERREEGQ